MIHHTKNKGDIAVTKTITDLTVKGYYCYLPLSEHLPVDLIAAKDNKFYRIQIKYSSIGRANRTTSWADKNGNHIKEYSQDAFDYYAIYIPDIDMVIYPSIKFKGSMIRWTPSQSSAPFYYYEDFLEFTDIANKRNFKDFGIDLSRPKFRKVIWPTKEELEKILWEIPTSEIAKKYAVGHQTISKWAKKYGIKTPGRGYWQKINKPR